MAESIRGAPEAAGSRRNIAISFYTISIRFQSLLLRSAPSSPEKN